MKPEPLPDAAEDRSPTPAPPRPPRRWARAFPWLAELGPATLRADLVAGLLGAILVLPQGIAFATLAGLPPQYGLYAAVIPCAIAALAGSSRHVMSGPTNANSLALYAMLTPLAVAGSTRYVEMALAVTIMVGVVQLLVSLLRLGSLANFISPAALHGFTSGAACLIAIYALRDLLGIAGDAHGAFAVLQALVLQAREAHPAYLAVGCATLIVAAGVKAWNRRWPFMLLGLAAGTTLAWVLNRHAGTDVPTVGAVPAALPPLHWPQVPWSSLPELAGIAAVLSIVALAQAISIAKAVATRSGQRIDPNREFLGQGLANVAGGFFSSYVSCGSLNRSMPNYEAGARTPLAAVFSAALLVVLIALTGPLLALIPMAGIAGLLILVAWSLLDLPRWRYLWRMSPEDFAVAALTFAATVAIRMEIAILLGTVASLGSYLHRTAKPALRTMGFDSMEADRPFVVIDDNPAALPECRHLKLLRMEGSVYFGATSHVAGALHALRQQPEPQPHLLVMTKSMNFVDLAGVELWDEELKARRAMGGDLYFHRPRPQVIQQWERTGFLDRLGRDHVFRDKKSAIAAILGRFGPDPCVGCGRRVMFECRASGTTSEEAPAQHGQAHTSN